MRDRESWRAEADKVDVNGKHGMVSKDDHSSHSCLLKSVGLEVFI